MVSHSVVCLGPQWSANICKVCWGRVELQSRGHSALKITCVFFFFFFFFACVYRPGSCASLHVYCKFYAWVTFQQGQYCVDSCWLNRHGWLVDWLDFPPLIQAHHRYSCVCLYKQVHSETCSHIQITSRHHQLVFFSNHTKKVYSVTVSQKYTSVPPPSMKFGFPVTTKKKKESQCSQMLKYATKRSMLKWNMQAKAHLCSKKKKQKKCHKKACTKQIHASKCHNAKA